MLEYLLIGGVATGAFVILKGIGTYNRMMSLDERCTTAYADIDALMKHRHSLIPGLVETVKGVVGQENRVIDTVMHAFTETMRSNNMETRLNAEQNLGNTINNMFSSLDKLPQMNTSSHFIDLRNSFKDVENRITAARRFYNNTVEEHNATLRQFPANLIGMKLQIAKRRQFSLGVERILMDEPVSFKF